MANNPGFDTANLWKNQPIIETRISLDQLVRKAQKFEKRILWRNAREYVASAIVAGTFGYSLWVVPDTLIRAGCALVIAGTLFVACTLHKRGAARSTPAEMARQTYLEFHRAELIRQRDLLRSVCSWYLVPFVPGLGAFLFGVYLQTMRQPNAAAHANLITAVFYLAAAGCTLLFLGVAKLNSWAARKIQREIDALDEMARES